MRRTDPQRISAQLLRLARQETNGRVACRLLALAYALDGMSREDAAARAGMDRQTLRDWVIRFHAEGLEGPRDRPARTPNAARHEARKLPQAPAEARSDTAPQQSRRMSNDLQLSLASPAHANRDWIRCSGIK